LQPHCSKTVYRRGAAANEGAPSPAKYCDYDRQVTELAVLHGHWRRGKPHLIQTHQPHAGEAHRQQHAGHYLHVNEGMGHFNEIPRAHIHQDGGELQCDKRALRRPHIGMGEHETREEKTEAHHRTGDCATPGLAWRWWCRVSFIMAVEVDQMPGCLALWPLMPPGVRHAKVKISEPSLTTRSSG